MFLLSTIGVAKYLATQELNIYLAGTLLMMLVTISLFIVGYTLHGKSSRKSKEIATWVKAKYQLEVKKPTSIELVQLDIEVETNEGVQRSLGALASKEDLMGTTKLLFIAVQEIDGELHLVDENGTPYEPVS